MSHKNNPHYGNIPITQLSAQPEARIKIVDPQQIKEWNTTMLPLKEYIYHNMI